MSAISAAMRFDNKTPRKRTALQAALQGDGTRLAHMKADDPTNDSPRIKISLPRVGWLQRMPVPDEIERNGKLMSGNPPPDHNQDDYILIHETAQAVRLALMSNAVRCVLDAGEQLKMLHDRLAKRNRYDTSRIGWVQAFKLRPAAFPFGRLTAERLILIYEFFGQWERTSLEVLPCHWSALFILVSRFKDPARIERLVNEGQISPLAEPAELLRLGRSLGFIKKTETTYRALYIHIPLDLINAARKDRIAAVMKALDKLKLRPEDLTGSVVKFRGARDRAAQHPA